MTVDLASIVAAEPTDFGWRALTERGELLEVRSMNGHIAALPDSVPRSSIITDYLDHSNRALDIFHNWRDWHIDAALREADAALRLFPTAHARYNRAIIAIMGGQWEAFADWEARFEIFDQIGLQPRAGVERWIGQDLRGKTIVLCHEQGFGETIQQLRYVPVLQEMGADVRLLMPLALQHLAAQLARLGDDGDFFCPMLSLMHVLRQEPAKMPRGTYLHAEPALVAKWACVLGPRNGRKRIGIAWESGTPDDRFPRSAPPELFLQALARPNVELFSVQQQTADGAAERLGITQYRFIDFADVAALMTLLDEIVTIDTAALHLAGALGHPKVTGLLPTYAAWRWHSEVPIYPGMRLVRQQTPGDWESAFISFGRHGRSGGE